MADVKDGGLESLLEVSQRLKFAEIGNDLYLGVESWPAGAWSVVIPPEGRRIFEIWLSDFEAARKSALLAARGGVE